MLWPFNHFRKPRRTPPGTIEAIYGMIVTQAREPLFYRVLGVPDTVNGRFDLLLLHLWLLLRRLRAVQGAAELSQALFDRFCEDMDDNLREMGVGDQTVPKRMRAFGEAFYGRVQAYDQAMEAGGEALAAAICKNILNGTGFDQAERLAAYARASEADLGRTDDAALLRASFKFPRALSQDVTP
ncbi:MULTISPECIES: ubiquinol-cytochrome C chaperone family protein [unclassified Bradyrhizobium]|uniref:ubiquinol-cytochrome C chaperone family protein n=1 Tax=unclassified Bradyrhizobium TaxID=2631580 RepID=UPI001CD453A6|nr:MULTISPECIES: ubiquinol-cytochrome C chaperone family protein [unclassified Bradyrhizobium]MCA1376233.1 ubiquinol-cytochrome C chaperone family protein [Bradyrhizobium sp. IC4060]MCA1482958.1 ubiquinol-cytochrome C chaperone family protein [Bradyrhizobium sp. IC4061]MCA1541212.1 ubiquinol-cytochrome C chaperone family protein [Bradyrhizobium sp. NBAIM32]